MSVFVLRTQFSLGEELGVGVASGFSLMTCRGFHGPLKFWLCGWEQGSAALSGPGGVLSVLCCV